MKTEKEYLDTISSLETRISIATEQLKKAKADYEAFLKLKSLKGTKEVWCIHYSDGEGWYNNNVYFETQRAAELVEPHRPFALSTTISTELVSADEKVVTEKEAILFDKKATENWGHCVSDYDEIIDYIKKRG